MNMFRFLPGDEFSFSLFSTWDWNDEMDAELARLGVDRWTVFSGYKPGQMKRLRESSAAFACLIDQLKPDVVYVNTMNGMGLLFSETAKKHGVPVRIVHSHNSAFGSGSAAAKAIAHSLGKRTMGESATARLAVSRDAGIYLFGNRAFEVINNGVDTSRFKYDFEAGQKLRGQYGIPDDALLFGSVGRFEQAKNPLFQLRVFAEILKSTPDAYYFMVGDGDMRMQVEAIIDGIGVGNRIIMPGYLSDPAQVYSALDCFLMPSIHEGLAMVCVEAQCAGCGIVCSEALPPEAQITDALITVPLVEGQSIWAKRALEVAHASRNRIEYADRVAKAGFDVEGTAREMANFFRGGGALS